VEHTRLECTRVECTRVECTRVECTRVECTRVNGLKIDTRPLLKWVNDVTRIFIELAQLLFKSSLIFNSGIFF
jgi:hypothetical protein